MELGLPRSLTQGRTTPVSSRGLGCGAFRRISAKTWVRAPAPENFYFIFPYSEVKWFCSKVKR